MATLTQGDAQNIYDRKRCSMREAVDKLRTQDTMAVPIATGQPAAFLSALAERNDFLDLLIFSGLLIEPYPVLQQPGVRLVSGFYGPIERLMKSAGARVQYLPADFLGWERYAMQIKPRVVVSLVAAMDANGFLNLGLHSGATFNAFLEAARDPNRLAIAEVNRTTPHVLGVARFGDNRIHVSDVDCIVESERPVFELPTQEATAEDHAIAGHVEQLIDNGATLQIGIGGVPNLIAELLAGGKKGDFGIHTEMFTDGIMRLHAAGKVSNRKGVYDGFSVATFAAGSRQLYDWMDGNPDIRMLPVAQVNDPSIIRLNRNMVSINGALAVDLTGQVMADTIGASQYSGVGGHELFVIGARNSVGGKSTICLHSTARVDGKLASTIVPTLPLGTPVTTPRQHVQFVVTEFGAADLSLLTDAERRDALVAIAHPDFRDELRAAAHERT